MKVNQLPKVALVYDWLSTQHGGAENVLLALHQVFPKAPLFTSIYDAEAATWASGFDVKTTWLQKLPMKNHRLLSILMPIAFETLDLSSYDIIISVSSAEAKGVVTQPHQLHIAYVLTPPRYLYSHKNEYLSSLPFKNIVKYVLALPMQYLTWWDQAAAHRSDVMIPISNVVGQRISQYYDRKPTAPIYPPIKISKLQATSNSELLERYPVLKEPFFLVVSRLISYKKIDLVVQAAIKSGKKLVIIGDGPEKNALNLLARGGVPNQIQFLGHQSQSVVDVFRQQAHALLMPGVEDFGITAIENIATGKPVIVHKESGAAELIKDGKTGVLLKQLTVPELIRAMSKIEELHFDPVMLQESVAEYATDAFVMNFKREAESHWQRFRKKGSHEQS